MDNTFIANLLIELLSEYNRVSLPCLGSFVGQYKPAYFSADGKILYPPSKQIEFHQNEIWNDERLEKLISDYENISLGEAKERLAFWIDGVCAELAVGNTVVLPHLGEFTVAYGNRLKFIQYENKNLLLESYGLEPVELEEATAPQSPVPPPTDTDNKNRINNIPDDTPPRKKRTWIWVTLLVILVLLITGLALVYFRVVEIPSNIKDKYPWVSALVMHDENIDERSLYPVDEDDDIYANTNNNAEYTPVDSITDNNTVISDSLDVIIDSTALIAIDSTANDTIVNAPAEVYHIIVRSANTYNDARTIAKEWAKKDYVVQILYTNEKEPYKLSIEYFNNEEEANGKLQELKKEDNSFKDAVVFKYIGEDN